MESSFILATDKKKNKSFLFVGALLVVGVFGACYLVFNQSASTALATDDLAKIYNDWKETNGFKYGGAEDQIRFSVFSTNYQKIVNHNKKTDSTFKLGLNPFAAMTQDEFAATHLGYNGQLQQKRNNLSPVKVENVNIPDSIDWTTKGVVTPVKNQGQCGSCWAFSATGSTEAALAINNGELVSLSEQELVDCSGAFGNGGCEGGLMDEAFQYIAQNGLVSETDYPYSAADQQCNIPPNAKVYRIKAFQDVAANNSDALKSAVAQQPVSVAIEADQGVFQLYQSGVITGDSCGTNLDHGVLAVGYGTLDGQAYFKVKNSWGPNWGQEGYVLIGIEDKEGVCGIQMNPSYPIVE